MGPGEPSQSPFRGQRPSYPATRAARRSPDQAADDPGYGDYHGGTADRIRPRRSGSSLPMRHQKVHRSTPSLPTSADPKGNRRIRPLWSQVEGISNLDLVL